MLRPLFSNVTCQESKYSTHKPARILQPLPIPNQVWEEISMDFVTRLPPVAGKSVIWVGVDRLSKSAHFIPMPSHFSATFIAPIFLAEIYILHGMPKSIVSDKDRVFVNKFWKDSFRLSGTTLAFNSSYHPESNGQTESPIESWKHICVALLLIPQAVAPVPSPCRVLVQFLISVFDPDNPL